MTKVKTHLNGKLVEFKFYTSMLQEMIVVTVDLWLCWATEAKQNSPD